MQSLNELNALEKVTSEIFSYASQYSNFVSAKTDNEIKNATREIKTQFALDYTKPLAMSAKEAQQLKGMISDFLVKKKDLFNTHYIQLLAWHIHDIKIMELKTRNVELLQSILEYAPSPLLPISATNKIFTLFSPKRIEPEKVSTALLLNYLNNYEVASSRFKNVLRRYLKNIRYLNNVDIFFDMEKLIQYLWSVSFNDFEKSKINILKFIENREYLLNSKYFTDTLKRSIIHVEYKI